MLAYSIYFYVYYYYIGLFTLKARMDDIMQELIYERNKSLKSQDVSRNSKYQVSKRSLIGQT